MTQVVFFLPRQPRCRSERRTYPVASACDRMVGVDPRVHTFRRRELGVRRSQLGGDDRRPRTSAVTRSMKRVIYLFRDCRRVARDAGVASIAAPGAVADADRADGSSLGAARRRPAAGESSETMRFRSDSAATRFASSRSSPARAKAEGADTLITAGGVQSNHARATAAVAAQLGMRAILVANGEPQRSTDRQCAARSPARRRNGVRGGA